MVKLIETTTKFDAWIKGVRFLGNNKGSSLVLNIEHPEQTEKLTPKLINKLLDSEEAPLMEPMSDTLFPQRNYELGGRDEVFHIYPEETFPELRKNPPPNMNIRWGTYAYRLVRHPTGMNPLEQLVDKMIGETRNKNPKQNCYELSLWEDVHDISLYRPVSDGKFYRGGPCLSHLSFKLIDRKVHLTALYRNHDYAVTVPCNLLGLYNLMNFVSQEVEVDLGTLTVHSASAFLKRPLANLERFFQLMEV